MQVSWSQASDAMRENKTIIFTLFAFLFCNLLFPFVV
jgi:hypothetical protein